MANSLALDDLTTPPNEYRVAIFGDISGSTYTTLSKGDDDANTLIRKQLNSVADAMRLVDPTIEEHGSEGDSIFLSGTNLMALIEAAVRWQSGEQSWPKHELPLRIAFGSGPFEVRKSTRGDYVERRGITLILAHALLQVCPNGGVVLTEGARAKILDKGFDSRFVRKQARLKGFKNMETYYEVKRLGESRRNARYPIMKRVIHIMTLIWVLAISGGVIEILYLMSKRV